MPTSFNRFIPSAVDSFSSFNIIRFFYRQTDSSCQANRLSDMDFFVIIR